MLFRSYAPNQTQQLGAQLQGIGDFNGDGIQDYAVLAPGYFNLGGFNGSYFENNQGALYIYYGSTSGGFGSTPDVVLSTQFATNIIANALNELNMGTSQLSNFTAIGDINGDGYDDIAIASPSTTLNTNIQPTTQDGAIYVVFGGPT